MSSKSWHSTESVWAVINRERGVGDIGMKLYDTKKAARRARYDSSEPVIELRVWKEGRGDG